MPRSLSEAKPGLVARAIYQHSLRAGKPFIVINCVAIPENLLESELFGYEKGAFTGASRRRIGKIEQANGGTIFFDEIGDMPHGLQAKILRLLQERSIERLGGMDTISVDVRIIAATNRNLEMGLAYKRFREDLYYRLKVVTVWLPGLSERQGDISLLSNYFLARYAKEIGIDNPGITDEAIAILNSYPWPGNVRELENTIQKALIFNLGVPVSVEDVSQSIRGISSGKGAGAKTGDEAITQWVNETLASKATADLFESSMDRFAGILIRQALNLTGGNRSRAAKLLGVSRPTLHSRIEKYNLKIETSVKEE